MSYKKDSYKKKIVVIGGGTGTFTTLVGCKQLPFSITAIVSTADDGGSSGILRDELGVLPPGDIRQALVALSEDSSILRQLFTYRFDTGNLKGHQFGNLFISALEKITGRFDKAVLEAGNVLAIQGLVLPVTTDNVRLCAKTKKGTSIRGQHAIDEFIWSSDEPVESLWLEPKATIHPEAQKAIMQADIIVIGPGSIFTSLIPNLLVGGMKEALQKTKAKIVYVTNLMTEKGQTDSFFVEDYVKLLSSFIGEDEIDYVLFNNRTPSSKQLEKYQQEMERRPVVRKNIPAHGKTRYIGADLLSRNVPAVSKSDILAKTRSLIRHDSVKLGQILYYLTLDGKLWNSFNGK